MPTDRPQGSAATNPGHPWNGDDEGHNCVDCDPMSVWKCDRPAHPPRSRVTKDESRKLADAQRARRTTPVPNKGLA